MTLIRHIHACNDARLPGGRIAILVDGQLVGWSQPALVDECVALGAARDPAGLRFAPAQLAGIAKALAGRGRFRWRAEAFDVRADPDGPVLAQIDRGALPAFGIGARGIHLNGLVGDRLWVARRAKDKPLDPGKLDHLVAGGIAAGDTAESTVIKEAGEEAGLPPELARRAVRVGKVEYAMERQEGLRRDTLYCYDLELPPDFVPIAADGEVEAFELWELSRVLETVRTTDQFKFNCNLVLIDLFLRRDMVPAAEAAVLRGALATPPAAPR